MEKGSQRYRKLCQVCGDQARCFNYGGLSCVSCGSFFRRAVESRTYITFICNAKYPCIINLARRNDCKACRFKKCVSIGMQINWIISVEERFQKIRRRSEDEQLNFPGNCQARWRYREQNVERAMPLNLPSQVSKYAPFTSSISKASVDEIISLMTADEQNQIRSLMEAYHRARMQIPFYALSENSERQPLQIIEMFITSVCQLALFSQLNPDFAELNNYDQKIVLKESITEMCLLRSAMCFDMQTNQWTCTALKDSRYCLQMEDIKNLIPMDLNEKHMKFLADMKKLEIDEPTGLLFIMVVLFSPKQFSLTDELKISHDRDKYLKLAKTYLWWKHGGKKNCWLYRRFLSKLDDLRELSTLHRKCKLLLAPEDARRIQTSLMTF